jgi:hypothetical protein
MVKGLSLLTFALVGIAGLAQAQTATGSGSPPLDPQGRPYVGANDWRPGPGDPQYSRSRAPMSQAGAAGQTQQPSSDMSQGGPSQAMAPDGMEKPAFKDEYGFMYNSRGDRVDARGRIIAPPQTSPGAAAR